MSPEGCAAAEWGALPPDEGRAAAAGAALPTEGGAAAAGGAFPRAAAAAAGTGAGDCCTCSCSCGGGCSPCRAISAAAAARCLGPSAACIVRCRCHSLRLCGWACSSAVLHSSPAARLLWRSQSSTAWVQSCSDGVPRLEEQANPLIRLLRREDLATMIVIPTGQVYKLNPAAQVLLFTTNLR